MQQPILSLRDFFFIYAVFESLLRRNAAAIGVVAAMARRDVTMKVFMTA